MPMPKAMVATITTAIVANEAAEMFAARLVLLVRVIRQRVDAGVLQKLGGFVHGLAREAVDDAGVAGVLLADELQQLLAGIVALGDPVADVRAIEAGDEHARRIQLQARDDLLARGGVRRGGERDARHCRIAIGQHRQPHVLRAEVVTPLGNAVRFVDGEERDVRLHPAARGSGP